MKKQNRKAKKPSYRTLVMFNHKVVDAANELSRQNTQLSRDCRLLTMRAEAAENQASRFLERLQSYGAAVAERDIVIEQQNETINGAVGMINRMQRELDEQKALVASLRRHFTTSMVALESSQVARGLRPDITEN